MPTPRTLPTTSMLVVYHLLSALVFVGCYWLAPAGPGTIAITEHEHLINIDNLSYIPLALAISLAVLVTSLLLCAAVRCVTPLRTQAMLASSAAIIVGLDRSNTQQPQLQLPAEASRSRCWWLDSQSTANVMVAAALQFTIIHVVQAVDIIVFSKTGVRVYSSWSITVIQTARFEADLGLDPSTVQLQIAALVLGVALVQVLLLRLSKAVCRYCIPRNPRVRVVALLVVLSAASVAVLLVLSSDDGTGGVLLGFQERYKGAMVRCHPHRNVERRVGSAIGARPSSRSSYPWMKHRLLTGIPQQTAATTQQAATIDQPPSIQPKQSYRWINKQQEPTIAQPKDILWVVSDSWRYLPTESLNQAINRSISDRRRSK
jgi:hypothetical protein